jgi:hypothetical protein
MSDEQDGQSGGEGPLRGVMGRLLSGAERELRSGDRLDAAKGAIGSVLETGDKAKTEIVKMVAREVRGYLEALELKDELKDLLGDYELEVNATFRLKPLLQDEEPESEPEAVPEPETEPETVEQEPTTDEAVPRPGKG